MPCAEASGRCSSSYEQTRAQLSCSDPRHFATSGRCEDGKRFLFYGTGFITAAWYFDEAGRFLGDSHRSDVVTSPCYGFAFTPAPTVCDAARVEEVICGGETNAAPLGTEADVRARFERLGHVIPFER